MFSTISGVDEMDTLIETAECKLFGKLYVERHM
jgi:hypothetical protein